MNQLRDLFTALAERLLQMATLPEHAFQLMPFTFEFELVHDQVRKGLGSMSEHLERPDRFKGKSLCLSHHCSPFQSGPETGGLAAVDPRLICTSPSFFSLVHC